MHNADIWIRGRERGREIRCKRDKGREGNRESEREKL